MRDLAYSLDDTIAAIATPLGQGGIGIVRLSGPQALETAKRIFVLSSHCWDRITTHRLYHGHVVDPSDGHIVDEALLVYMKAPRSYTAEDVVEIQGHGGPVPLRKILQLCLAHGARMAREGEFTLRAFLNGRLDLAQAEAVLDIITAKTEAALRVAVSQLGGRLSNEIRKARQGLLDALAYLEASIDFGDDVPEQDITPDLQACAERLSWLLREAERGIIYRQGIRTVIVGRPNVGKSSLLNRLLRVDRAIVTPIPGTTRDTLEETFTLQGIPFVLTDTAGISETEDIIEQLGIERSRRSIAEADMILVVFDASVPPTPDDWRVASLVEQRSPVVVVLNKCDLPRASDYAMLLPHAPRIPISALTGEGLPELEQCLVDMVLSGHAITSEEPIASNPRHRDLIQKALEHTQQALHDLRAGLPEDLVAINVSEAVHALGEITGESATEDLLATIFGRFCIGK